MPASAVQAAPAGGACMQAQVRQSLSPQAHGAVVPVRTWMQARGPCVQLALMASAARSSTRTSSASASWSTRMTCASRQLANLKSQPRAGAIKVTAAGWCALCHSRGLVLHSGHSRRLVQSRGGMPRGTCSGSSWSSVALGLSERLAVSLVATPVKLFRDSRGHRVDGTATRTSHARHERGGSLGEEGVFLPCHLEQQLEQQRQKC